MQPVTILKRALAAQRRIEENQAILAECEERAIERFNRTGSDEIVTPAGIIIYKRSTRWVPRVEMIGEAQEELDLRFDDVFEAHVERSVPTTWLDDLLSTYPRAIDYVKEEVAWKVRRTFQNLVTKDPENGLVQDAAPFFDQKVSEKVTFKGADDGK